MYEHLRPEDDEHRNENTAHIDMTPSYRGVLNVLLNDLAVESLTLRADTLLNVPEYDSISIHRACLVGPTIVYHRLSSLFNDRWLPECPDAAIPADCNVIEFDFAGLRGFVTVDRVRRHINDAFTIPSESEADFQVLTAFGTTVIRGKSEPIEEITLIDPVQIRVPGMRATRIEMFEKSEKEKNTRIVIVPVKKREELENVRSARRSVGRRTVLIQLFR